MGGWRWRERERERENGMFVYESWSFGGGEQRMNESMNEWRDVRLIWSVVDDGNPNARWNDNLVRQPRFRDEDLKSRRR